MVYEDGTRENSYLLLIYWLLWGVVMVIGIACLFFNCFDNMLKKPLKNSEVGRNRMFLKNYA